MELTEQANPGLKVLQNNAYSNAFDNVTIGISLLHKLLQKPQAALKFTLQILFQRKIHESRLKPMKN